MATHVNDGLVRERCCRCIANMCQLASSGAPAQPCGGDAHTDRSNDSSSDGSIADVLVEQGAVELALGTLAMSSRLSAKGRAWAALAVLNLVCLSRDGAQRA
ncbi:hypothetical protein DQ04_23161000, partial [Trypanosoma grayi]|uniref:hypothetical protein n=1 Tax=Trypanosoma grayi TaxID=71804 RepID=UPI0004F42399